MKLYLVNYRNTGSEPFKSITNLPLEEAIKLADSLYNNSSCKAHRRFGSEFVRYYEDRKQVENYLYNSFQQIGGRPKVRCPIYFTLHNCEEISTNFGECREIKLDLNQIDEKDISFTLGDSMALYYKGELNKIFTKNELLQQLKKMNSDIVQGWNYIREQYGFIEAQLWNDKYYVE